MKYEGHLTFTKMVSGSQLNRPTAHVADVRQEMKEDREMKDEEDIIISHRQ